MSVHIWPQLQSTQQPVDTQCLQEILHEIAIEPLSPKRWAEQVAHKLSKKDSRYKFLVLITEIAAGADAQLNARSSLAAVWDAENDGSLSIQIPDEPLRVMTVFWIYAN